MKYIDRNVLRSLTILLLTIFLSCNKDNKLPNKFIGTWTQDTTGQISSSIKEFTLLQDGTFKFKRSEYEFSKEYKGKFEYEVSAKENQHLLTFKFPSWKDSINILKFDDSTLQVDEWEIRPTKYVVQLIGSKNVYRKTDKK